MSTNPAFVNPGPTGTFVTGPGAKILFDFRTYPNKTFARLILNFPLAEHEYNLQGTCGLVVERRIRATMASLRISASTRSTRRLPRSGSAAIGPVGSMSMAPITLP